MFRSVCKKMTALCMALILVLSAAAGAFPVQAAAKGGAEYQRFMSFNLRYDITSHPLMSTDVRGAHLLETILKYDVDSIGFQEATDNWMNYLRPAMDEIGYAYVGVGRDTGTDDPSRSSNSNEFASIFYKKDVYDLVDSGDFWVSATPDVRSGRAWDASNTRICTYAVLRHKETGDMYAHFNTHLDHNGVLARHNGVRLIANRIASVSKQHGNIGCVVTGDFNDVRFDAENEDYNALMYNFMTSRMDDSREIANNVLVDGSTWSGYQNPDDWEEGISSGKDKPGVDTDSSPIDYLFLSKGRYEVSTYTVVDDTFTFEYGGKTYTDHPISDHYGVYCEARLLDKPGDTAYDESKLIHIPADTYIGGEGMPEEVLRDTIRIGAYENAAASGSALSSLDCGTDTPVSNLLDNENIVRPGNYTGNVFWEVTADLKAFTEIQAISYTVGTTDIPDNIEVHVSENGGSWEKVGSTITQAAEPGSTSYIILNEPVKMQYVKLVMADTHNDTAIQNLSVYGIKTRMRPLEKDVYTPVSGPSTTGSERYTNLFDGNLQTKFYIRTSDTVSVEWKLDKPETAIYYTLTSANDHTSYNGRFPKSWTLYGSASGDDGSWTVIDEKTKYTGFSETNFTEFFFEIEKPEEYMYYRIDFTELSDNGNMQFSELDLYVQGASAETKPIDQSTVTPVSGPKSGETEGYEKLFDGNVNTKLYYRDEIPEPIIWKTSEPMTVSQYSLTTANDSASYTGRTPREWILYGSASGEKDSWTVIDIVEDYTMPDVNCQEFFFDVENPKEYQYYQLQFTALGTNDRLQISEVTLYAEFDLADYTEVDELLPKVPKVVSIYTEETVDALFDVLASIDRTKRKSEQGAVDAMAQALENAIDNLALKTTEPSDVNKVLLKRTIDYANAQDTTCLNAIVKRQFEAALAKAQEVYDDPDAVQTQVNTAMEDLLDMIHMLSYTSDSRALEELVGYADTIKDNLHLYKEDGKEEFLSALQEAVVALNDEYSLDADYEDAWNRLNDAISKLELKPALNTDALEKIIARGEQVQENKDSYLDIGWGAFETALESARQALETAESQEEIDDAAMALYQSLLDLRLIPNKDLLKDLLEAGSRVNARLYTADSIIILEEALEQGNMVFRNGQATQEEVISAASTVQTALDRLEKTAETAGGQEAEQFGDHIRKTSSGKMVSPKTGDTLPVVSVIILTISLAAGIAIFHKKSDKN